MPNDDGILRVAGEEGHFAGAMAGHGGDQRVGRVEHRSSRGTHDFDDHPLDLRQQLRRIDLGEAQVVAFADIGHHRHVALIEAQPGARMPPRAVSSTAASTSGLPSTLAALRGPLQSSQSMRRSSM